MQKIKNMPLIVKSSLLFGTLLLCIVVVAGSLGQNSLQNSAQSFFTDSLTALIDSNAGEVSMGLERLGMLENSVSGSSSSLKGSDNSDSQLYNVLMEYEMKNIAFSQVVHDFRQCNDAFRNSSEVTFAPIGGTYASAFYVDESFALCAQLPNAKHHEKINAQKGIFSSQQVQDTDWYRKAVEKNGEPYWFVQSEYSGRIFMAKLLKRQEVTLTAGTQERNLGVLAVSYDVSWLQTKLDFSRLTAGTWAVLEDEAGNIIFSTSASPDNAVEILAGRQENDYYRRVNALQEDLTLVTFVPMKDIHMVMHQAIIPMLLITLLAAASGLIMVWVCSRALLRPIKHLSDYMLHADSLQKIPCEEAGSDEIGILYRSFNEMMLRINSLLKTTAQAAEEKKQAEVKALQAQINPHFIYNTLDSVCCRSLMRGDEENAEILSSLASIMRYNMRHPEDLVSLQQACDIIRKYHSIQQNCHNYQLTLCFVVDPDCEKALIPKMILQPLVENAIQYGVQNGQKECIIAVSASHTEDTLTLRVTDTGKDADIEAINRYITGEKGTDTQKGSFGVRNVYQRLKLAFDERAGLCCEKDEQGCTTIRMWLPYVVL